MLSLVTALALAAPSAAADPPRVEIVHSAGRLDSPGGRPRGGAEWTRLRLELTLKNHLPVEVRDLSLDVSLLAEGAPIPGWTFRDLPLGVALAGGEARRLRVARDLPERRRAPAATAVAYRVRLQSYRVRAPTLELAFELLSSSHPSDQRAALASFERDPRWPRAQVEALAAALRATLESLPPDPSATDALRLLLAVRGIGTLRLASEVPLLLRMPERLDRETWGRAVLDLASRMVVASRPDDPRLRALPRWARRVATLLGVNARDALPEAAREAILRMGDEAVPVLVRTAAESRSAPVRARARRLLERLGRGTPQAQVRAGSLAHRARVIRALGDTGDPAAIPALVDVLDGPEAVAEAAARALVTAGPAAIGPLVDALGSPDDAPARSALVRLGRAHPRALRARAAAEGVEVEGRPIPAAVVAELAAVRRATRARALEAEIADAMALGAAGAHRAALARLDEVYAKAPELYMRHADPIARLYVARAEKLLERGDYEAALRVLTDGESVRPLPEIAMRTTDARVALARGFLELGDLERAQEELEAAPVPRRADVLDARRAWLAAAARAALSNGRTGEARRYVDEARRLAPEDLGLRILDRRVALDEHLAVVLAAALGLPALALALGLVVRSRLERRRLERLAAALERQALEEAAAPPS